MSALLGRTGRARCAWKPGRRRAQASKPHSVQFGIHKFTFDTSRRARKREAAPTGQAGRLAGSRRPHQDHGLRWLPRSAKEKTKQEHLALSPQMPADTCVYGPAPQQPFHAPRPEGPRTKPPPPPPPNKKANPLLGLGWWDAWTRWCWAKVKQPGLWDPAYDGGPTAAARRT